MKRQPSIISHLAERFGLDSNDDAPGVQAKMEVFFEEGGAWPLDDWPYVSVN
jgi:hypothetical protein